MLFKIAQTINSYAAMYGVAPGFVFIENPFLLRFTQASIATAGTQERLVSE